jgi:ADP-ribosyl-[dinitrogen reductase] hydrolase
MSTSREDRIKGVMLGMACGDALGAGYETGKRVPDSGATMCGGGFGFKPGEFTDDTQQAVCVAVARSEPLKVSANLLQWYRSHPKDIGGQTRAVMRRVKTPRGLAMASRAYARRQESLPRPRSWDPGTGNGSLMRTGPVALPFLGDRERIAVAARKVSDLTHADAWSGDACVLWSLAIDLAVGAAEEFDLAAGMGAGLAYLPAERRGFWERAIRDGLKDAPWSQLRRNGSAVGCFRAALAAVADAGSLEDGLQLAVSIGGDTDTVAAVAGALLGAIHGASAVPDRWRREVWGWPGLRADGLEQLALGAAGVPALAA